MVRFERRPEEWEFNNRDRNHYRNTFWSCPKRLVEDGTWANLWRGEYTGVRCPSVTSVLPIVALHTWPDKNGAEGGWTGWSYLSRRRIGRLAGVDKDTVGTVFQQLSETGFLETRRVPRARHEGGYKTEYRLSCALYPDGEETFVPISANLFYGGTWALLPKPSYRHLLIVIRCLDPIRDEDAYLASIAEDSFAGEWHAFEGQNDSEDFGIDRSEFYDENEFVQQQILAERRANHPLSITDFENYSGLSRTAVIHALKALQQSLFGDRYDEENEIEIPPIPLVRRGNSNTYGPSWYATDRRARTWYWEPDVLNDPKRMAAVRRRFWGTP